MQKLFQIILDQYPDMVFSLYQNQHNNLHLYLEVIKRGIYSSSSVEIPIYNLIDDQYDWHQIANVLLRDLK